MFVKGECAVYIGVPRTSLSWRDLMLKLIHPMINIEGWPGKDGKIKLLPTFLFCSLVKIQTEINKSGVNTFDECGGSSEGADVQFAGMWDVGSKVTFFQDVEPLQKVGVAPSLHHLRTQPPARGRCPVSSDLLVFQRPGQTQVMPVSLRATI